MKTNKQNKTNKKTAAAQAQVGSTNIVSELKNRTEQLSETETANTAETETAPQETGSVNAPVKPYVNFAERDFNRKLSVEKVLEKLERWMPEQFKLAEVVGKWIWISFPEPPMERVRADQSGAGAWCETGGVLSNCIVQGNAAYLAGGGVNQGVCIDCTIVSNSVRVWGGGVRSSPTACSVARIPRASASELHHP
jgi:hypothetical protein